MKKKLLIILGAGSSSAVGLPSVKCLDRHMAQWAKCGTTDHFRELWQSAETYYERGPTGTRPALNFEKVLGDIVAMAHWMEPPPWGDTLRQAACCGTPPPHMKFRSHKEPEEAVTAVPLSGTPLVCDESDMLSDDCEVIDESSVEVNSLSEVEPAAYGAEHDWRGKYGAHIELTVEYSFLLERLAQHMRAESQRFNLATTSEESKYRKLLGGLRMNFDIGVYNLNYDTAALDALPGAYIGFSETGTFEPRVIHERKEWDFMYHLHGSVHHSLNRRYVGDQIVWRPSLNGEFFDGPEGRWSEPRSNGIKIPRTTLVAGGFKLDQLLFEPFQSFHASLVRHVHAADAILIGGYGFGDAHINFALRNRLSLTQDGLHVQDRPPVMVLTLAGETTPPMRRRDDLWARELGVTLCTGTQGHFFVEPGNPSDPIPTELVKRGAFEVDAQHRVAVWYGGFTEAVHRLPGIVGWLDGGADNVLTAHSTQGI
ncbi:MAG: SIR2 family protein [Acidobacteriaceae bacterium]